MANTGDHAHPNARFKNNLDATTARTGATSPFTPRMMTKQHDNTALSAPRLQPHSQITPPATVTTNNAPASFAPPRASADLAASHPTAAAYLSTVPNSTTLPAEATLENSVGDSAPRLPAEITNALERGDLQDYKLLRWIFHTYEGRPGLSPNTRCVTFKCRTCKTNPVVIRVPAPMHASPRIRSQLLRKLKGLAKSGLCRCRRCHSTKKHNPVLQAHAATKPKWDDFRPSRSENKRMKKAVLNLKIESGGSEHAGLVEGLQKVGKVARDRREHLEALKQQWHQEKNEIEQQIKMPEDFAALVQTYGTVPAATAIPATGALNPAAISKKKLPTLGRETEGPLLPGKTNLTAALLGVSTATNNGIAATSTESGIQALEARAAGRRQQESEDSGGIEED